MEYEQEQARIYAGVSIAEWDVMPGTRDWINPEKGGRSKCDLIMLYRMSNFIPAAANDAQMRKSERDAKLKRKR